MIRITIDLGHLSLDDILASKTGNSAAEIEIVRIIKLLKEKDIFEVKVIELNGQSERILNNKNIKEE